MIYFRGYHWKIADTWKGLFCLFRVAGGFYYEVNGWVNRAGELVESFAKPGQPEVLKNKARRCDCGLNQNANPYAGHMKRDNCNNYPQHEASA